MDYVSEFKEIYGNNLHDKSKIYDGIPELLDELMARRIKLSILSNKPHPLTQKVCDFYLSDWPFNPVFGQREDVPRKPDPAAAFEIAEMMKIEPGRILFVGDSDNDISDRQAAGMIPVGVSWGYGRLMNEPVEGMGNLIDNLQNLTSILTKIFIRMKTKAVRLYGKKDLRVEEFELPPLKEDEILAKVVSDSLCMSSYKAAIQGTDHKRIPNDAAENPVIIGHEFAGEIVEVGERWQRSLKQEISLLFSPH